MRSRIVTTSPVLETYDHDDVQHRHLNAYGIRWSSFYSEDGGGYGTLSWQEDRMIGPDYSDLGFLHEVILRKGLCNKLFVGVIVDISESSGSTSQAITVTAVGKGALLDFVPYNRVYQDQRVGKWVTPSEVSGSFVPNKFSVNNDEDALVLQPRRGTQYRSGEYVYARYEMPFGGGVERIAFSTVVELPFDWPGKVAIYDDTGLLWSKTASYSGVQTIKTNPNTTYIDLQFELTEWGENTASDGSVYGRFADVRVVGTDEQTVTIGRVARDLIEAMEPWGIVQDFTQLTAEDLELPGTVAFENDQTPKDIMTWCVKTAGINANTILAWGIDEDGRLYIEEQDQETVQYYVRRQPGREVSVRGSITDSAQKVYVVYTDAQGQVQRTAVASDDDTIGQLGGLYRQIAYKVSGTIDAETATAIAALRVVEQRKPSASSNISVRDHVYSATGKAKAVDEIMARGIIVVTDFRAGETLLSGDSDLRDQWTTHQLVGAEIDLNGRTARLIPAGAGNTFERKLARLLQDQQEGV